MKNITIEKIKIYIECIAIIGGAIFTFYKFVYEDYIIPSNYPPFVINKCELTKLSENDSVCFVNASLEIENKSKNRVNILYMKYEIKGINYSKGSDFDSTFKFGIKYEDENWEAMDEKDGGYGLEYTSDDVTGLVCGTLFFRNWLNEGESDRRTFIFPISKKYTTALLSAQIVFSRNKIPETIFQNFFVSNDGEILNLPSFHDYTNNYKDSIYKVAKEYNQLIKKFELETAESESEILIDSKIK